MLRFLADENFNGTIIRGLFRLNPAIDLLIAFDEGLGGRPDPEVLEWAATNRRILITHDVKTIPVFVRQRVAAELAMPGVFEVPTICITQKIIQDILMLNECSEMGEWEGQIVRLPL